MQGTEVSQAPSPAGMGDVGKEMNPLEVLVPQLLTLPGTKSLFLTGSEFQGMNFSVPAQAAL